MAGVNKRTTTRKLVREQVLNHEGSIVSKLTPLETLFSKVLGSFFGESTFYEERGAESGLKELEKIISEIDDNDKEYVLKLAELGRLYGMISYPVSILALAFNDDRFKGEGFSDGTGKNKLGYYTKTIVKRARDINEILAIHFELYKDRLLPAQMRKCLRERIETFDNYKLSKGLDKFRVVSLSDSIKLLRPRPGTDKRSTFYRSIIEGKVRLGDNKKVVRTEISKIKQTGSKDTTDLKESLYQANLQTLIYNLTNFYKADLLHDREVLDYVVGKIRDRKEVEHSKLLPFRFSTAYQELDNISNCVREIKLPLQEALMDALDASVENISNIEGDTAILIDVSGSMRYPISPRSVVEAYEIAILLGAIAYKKAFGDVFVFATECKRLTVSPRIPMFDLLNYAKSVQVGGGTELRKALEVVYNRARERGKGYDNLIILSDNDCYGYENGKLAFGSYFEFFTRGGSSSDDQINSMLDDGVVKRVWINNLLGNDFVITNTSDYRKRLITGFTERFVDMINLYSKLGQNTDIRPVIDSMLDEARKKKGR